MRDPRHQSFVERGADIVGQGGAADFGRGISAQARNAAQSITLVSPSGGPTAGGRTVTIVGTNFTGTTVVKFGITLASSCTVVSATKITAVAPAHAAGGVRVSVSTASGLSRVVTADSCHCG